MKFFRKICDRKIIFNYDLKITYLAQKKVIKAKKKKKSHNFFGSDAMEKKKIEK